MPARPPGAGYPAGEGAKTAGMSRPAVTCSEGGGMGVRELGYCY